LIEPAFHPERIAEYGALICAETYAEIGQWQPEDMRDLRADLIDPARSAIALARMDDDELVRGFHTRIATYLGPADS
jgi:hypothetical protein